jgi:hypothetical protein
MDQKSGDGEQRQANEGVKAEFADHRPNGRGAVEINLLAIVRLGMGAGARGR